MFVLGKEPHCSTYRIFATSTNRSENRKTPLTDDMPQLQYTLVAFSRFCMRGDSSILDRRGTAGSIVYSPRTSCLLP